MLDAIVKAFIEWGGREILTCNDLENRGNPANVIKRCDHKERFIYYFDYRQTENCEWEKKINQH